MILFNQILIRFGLFICIAVLYQPQVEASPIQANPICYQYDGLHLGSGSVQFHFQSVDWFGWLQNTFLFNLMMPSLLTLPSHLSMLGLTYNLPTVAKTGYLFHRLIPEMLPFWVLWQFADVAENIRNDAVYVLTFCWSGRVQEQESSSRLSSSGLPPPSPFVIEKNPAEQLNITKDKNGTLHIQVPAYYYHPGNLLLAMQFMPFPGSIKYDAEQAPSPLAGLYKNRDQARAFIRFASFKTSGEELANWLGWQHAKYSAPRIGPDLKSWLIPSESIPYIVDEIVDEIVEESEGKIWSTKQGTPKQPGIISCADKAEGSGNSMTGQSTTASSHGKEQAVSKYRSVGSGPSSGWGGSGSGDGNRPPGRPVIYDKPLPADKRPCQPEETRQQLACFHSPNTDNEPLPQMHPVPLPQDTSKPAIAIIQKLVQAMGTTPPGMILYGSHAQWVHMHKLYGNSDELHPRDWDFKISSTVILPVLKALGLPDWVPFIEPDFVQEEGVTLWLHDSEVRLEQLDKMYDKYVSTTFRLGIRQSEDTSLILRFKTTEIEPDTDIHTIEANFFRRSEEQNYFIRELSLDFSIVDDLPEAEIIHYGQLGKLAVLPVKDILNHAYRMISTKHPSMTKMRPKIISWWNLESRHRQARSENSLITLTPEESNLLEKLHKMLNAPSAQAIATDQHKAEAPFPLQPVVQIVPVPVYLPVIAVPVYVPVVAPQVTDKKKPAADVRAQASVQAPKTWTLAEVESRMLEKSNGDLLQMLKEKATGHESGASAATKPDVLNPSKKPLALPKELIGLSSDLVDEFIYKSVIAYNQQKKNSKAVLIGGRAAWWKLHQLPGVDRNKGWTPSGGDWDFMVNTDEDAYNLLHVIQETYRTGYLSLSYTFHVVDKYNPRIIRLLIQEAGKKQIMRVVDLLINPSTTISAGKSYWDSLPVENLETMRNSLDIFEKRILEKKYSTQANANIREYSRWDDRLKRVLYRKSLLRSEAASQLQEKPGQPIILAVRQPPVIASVEQTEPKIAIASAVSIKPETLVKNIEKSTEPNRIARQTAHPPDTVNTCDTVKKKTVESSAIPARRLQLKKALEKTGATIRCVNNRYPKKECTTLPGEKKCFKREPVHKAENDNIIDKADIARQLDDMSIPATQWPEQKQTVEEQKLQQKQPHKNDDDRLQDSTKAVSEKEEPESHIAVEAEEQPLTKIPLLPVKEEQPEPEISPDDDDEEEEEVVVLENNEILQTIEKEGSLIPPVKPKPGAKAKATAKKGKKGNKGKNKKGKKTSQKKLVVSKQPDITLVSEQGSQKPEPIHKEPIETESLETYLNTLLEQVKDRQELWVIIRPSVRKRIDKKKTVPEKLEQLLWYLGESEPGALITLIELHQHGLSFRPKTLMRLIRQYVNRIPSEILTVTDPSTDPGYPLLHTRRIRLKKLIGEITEGETGHYFAPDSAVVKTLNLLKDALTEAGKPKTELMLNYVTDIEKMLNVASVSSSSWQLLTEQVVHLSQQGQTKQAAALYDEVIQWLAIDPEKADESMEHRLVRLSAHLTGSHVLSLLGALARNSQTGKDAGLLTRFAPGSSWNKYNCVICKEGLYHSYQAGCPDCEICQKNNIFICEACLKPQKQSGNMPCPLRCQPGSDKQCGSTLTYFLDLSIRKEISSLMEQKPSQCFTDFPGMVLADSLQAASVGLTNVALVLAEAVFSFSGISEQNTSENRSRLKQLAREKKLQEPGNLNILTKLLASSETWSWASKVMNALSVEPEDLTVISLPEEASPEAKTPSPPPTEPSEETVRLKEPVPALTTAFALVADNQYVPIAIHSDPKMLRFEPVSSYLDLQLSPDEKTFLGGVSIMENPQHLRASGQLNTIEKMFEQAMVKIKAQKYFAHERLVIKVLASELDPILAMLTAIPDIGWLLTRFRKWEPDDYMLFRFLYSARYFHQALPYLVELMANPASLFFQPFTLVKIFDEHRSANYPAYRYYLLEGAPEWPDVAGFSEEVRAIIQLLTSDAKEQTALLAQHKQAILTADPETIDSGLFAVVHTLSPFTPEESRPLIDGWLSGAAKARPDIRWMIYRLRGKDMSLDELKEAMSNNQAINYGVVYDDGIFPFHLLELGLNEHEFYIFDSLISKSLKLFAKHGPVNKGISPWFMSLNDALYLDFKKSNELFSASRFGTQGIHNIQALNRLREEVGQAIALQIKMGYTANISLYPKGGPSLPPIDNYCQRLLEAFQLTGEKRFKTQLVDLLKEDQSRESALKALSQIEADDSDDSGSD